MAVLVTGATGFLGGTLVRRISPAGDVRVTGRNAEHLAALTSARRAALDLCDHDAVLREEAFRGVKTIIHCAALSSPWGSSAAFQAANVQATRNIIALANAVEAEHLIFVSSPSVYFRFEDQLNVREDMQLPAPVNTYAATKVQAETLVRESGLPWTILRPRGLYGAGDTALLPRLLRAARSGPLPLFRGGQVATDITHIDDVLSAVEAVMSAPEASHGQTFNVSGGVALPIKEIVERVCLIEGVQLKWRALPLGLALSAVRFGEAIARMRPSQPEPRVTAYGLGIFAYTQTLNLSKIEKVLGWRPQVSFEEGLDRTFGDPA